MNKVRMNNIIFKIVYAVIFLFIAGCAVNPVDQYNKDSSKVFFDRISCRLAMADATGNDMDSKQIVLTCAKMYPSPHIPSICEGIDQ